MKLKKNKLMIRRADSGMWQSSSSSPCGHCTIVSHLIMIMMMLEVMTGVHLMALMGKNLPVSFFSFLMVKDGLLHTKW